MKLLSARLAVAAAWIRKHRLITLLVVHGFALVLYLAGIRFLLVPVLVLTAAYTLSFPVILTSILSRIIASTFVLSAITVLSGLIQYVALRSTHFSMVAIIITLLWTLLLIRALNGRPERRLPFITRTDVFAFAIFSLFAVMFAYPIGGRHILPRMLELSAYQVVDSGHHFDMINDEQFIQKYTPGHYPLGFAYWVAFNQHNVYGSPQNIDWKTSLLQYYLQYVAVGVGLTFAAYYFLAAILARLRGGEKTLPYSWHAVTAASFAPVFVLFYLVPFFMQGFLNFYYVIALLVFGALYLIDEGAAEQRRNSTLYRVSMYLLLAFGATSSWTLLTPLVLITGALYILPDTLRYPKRFLPDRRWLPYAVPVLLAVAHLSLIYFQSRTIDLGSNEGINAEGNLHWLHYLVLFVGTVCVFYLLLKDTVALEIKRFLYFYVTPALLYVGFLLAIQYFQVNEIRYYAIKTALFVEILLLALTIAVLMERLFHSASLQWKQLVLVPGLVLASFIVLLSPAQRPFGELREMYKPVSGIAIPKFFTDDAAQLVALGQSNKIGYGNTAVLHYDQSSSHLTGFGQLAYKANQLQYANPLTNDDNNTCNNKLTGYLEAPQLTSDTDAQLKASITECAALARRSGKTYYIVTDRTSAPFIAADFADAGVKVVYK